MSSAEARPSRAPDPLLLCVVAAALARMVAVVAVSSARLVNEDQASLWLAGHDLLAGQLRQPTFPGQQYGIPFEGLGPAVLGLVGVPPWWGLPLTLAALSSGGWLVLAWAAWRSGARATALLAAGAPLLLATYPLFYVTSYGTGLGRFLAAAAAALGWAGRGRRSAASAALCAGLAFAFDPSTAIVLAPALVLALAARRGTNPGWSWPSALALLPGLGWIVLRAEFAARHPDYGLNPVPSLRPSLDRLQVAAQRLPHYLEVFAPAVAPSGSTAVAALVAVAAAALALALVRRRWVPLLALVATLLVTAASLGTGRALDDVSPFLPGSRVLLSLPLAGFLLLAAVESGWSAGPEIGRRIRLATASALALSGGLAFATTPAQATRLVSAAASAPVVPETPAQDLRQRCETLAALVASSGARLAVFTDDRAMAYGCPVVAPRSYATLFPPYEKRTWRLYEEELARRPALLVWSHDCTSTAGLRCQLLASDPPVARIEPAGLTTLEAVRRLGIGVRRYGPGCDPNAPSTCPDR